MQVIPTQASHWPVNYNSALVQSRDTAGRLHFGSVAVPPLCLVEFCDALLARLDAVPGFGSAYFGHEIRGLKGGTAHDDQEGHPENALDTFLEHIDPDRLDYDNWLIDVGLEVYDPSMVVQWSKHSHSEILKFIMPTLSEDEIQALQRRRTFHLDNVSQLDDFAGFRCEPGLFGRRHSVTYINVYTTDKCPTYQLHTGIWRRRRSKDLFPKRLEKLVDELDTMSKIYKDCAGSASLPPQEGCARLEIRVPLISAQHALRDVPEHLIRGWTYSVSPVIWWSAFLFIYLNGNLMFTTRHFKYFRMGGIYAALNLLMNTPAPYRPMRSSLTLGSILIYMMNAINYRPAEGRTETDLTQTCCWNLYLDDTDSDTVESDEDLDPVPIMLDHGLYFISGITLQEGVALRMGGGDSVTMESITRLYGLSNELDFKLKFNVRTWHPNPQERNCNRIQNRRKVPVDVRHIVDDDQLKAQDRTLSELGIAMMPLPQEAGPDITVLDVDYMDEDDQGPEETIDDFITRIWRQFPYDLFENAPNRRSNREPSHLLMTRQEREEATIDNFKTIDLRGVFSQVVVKLVTPQDWETLHFKRFFPDKGFRPPTRFQNFPNMRYFQEWNTLMQRLSVKDAEVVRSSIWRQFKTFKWLPLTDTDRVWNTKKVKGPQWTHLPFDHKKPTVQIALNMSLVRDPNGVQISVPGSNDEGSNIGIGIDV